MATAIEDINNTNRSFEQIYQDVLVEANQITLGKRTKIRISVPAVAATVLAALPKIMALRAQLVEQAPKFDVKHLDNLERYTSALVYANARFRAVRSPPASSVTVNDRATELRDQFYVDLLALQQHGIIADYDLPNMRYRAGYKNVSTDLSTLVSILQDNWSKVQGKIPIDEATLAEASAIARQLLETVGSREHAPEAVADAADKRQRIFALLVNSYGQVRSALRFLRYEQGDADEIAPSLYAGRRSSARKAEPSKAPDEVAQAHTSTAAADGVKDANDPNGSTDEKVKVR